MPASIRRNGFSVNKETGKMKLKQLAQVTLGHSFRSRLERVDDGNVLVIQMKDLSEDNRLLKSDLVRTDLAEPKERHLVKPDDILFSPRGRISYSVLIDRDIGTAVSAAPLLRLRPRRDKVIPAYLCWFVNLPATQAWLAGRATGSAVRTVGKQALENLEVAVPPLERQRRIVELAALAADEQRLLRELAGKCKQYMERMLTRMASESR